MSGMAVPYILPLENIIDEAVGGKAKGLAQLINLDLPVPKGFVIVNAQAGVYPHDLALAYSQLGGGKVAVRSSALGEDAGDNSFAGQFETLLDVQGEPALKQAIDACVHSLKNDRAAAYQQDREHQQESTMCIVVQNMVDAAFAGVLFTVDPVSGRYDRLVIDAIDGLGEALVSGEASSDHYLLANDNTMIEELLAGEKRLLNDNAIMQLANGARDAAKRMGEPLDMEWAIDQHGHLFWLQARPITTIGTDLNELNTPVNPSHVLTRCNIGEIFPGPCCPLTFSMQGQALDVSMQYMQVRFMGLSEHVYKGLPQIAYVSGYMFLDLSAGLEACRYTLLARAETTAQSICGRPLPELVEPEDKKSMVRRIWGIKDFIIYVREAHANSTDFAIQMKAFYIEYRHDSAAMFRELLAKRHWLTDVTKVHLQSSAMSGTMEGVIQAIISKGGTAPTIEEQAIAAKLFAGASNVESALLVEQLDKVVDLIAAHPHAKARFHDVSTGQALAWIYSPEAGAIKEAFESFLHMHGHRSYKELCFMEKAWIDEPEKLVASMQASLMSRFNNIAKPHHQAPIDLAGQPWLIRYLLPKAHMAIRRREYTKSMMVKVTHILKRGYRHLGVLLQQEGKLDDASLVYFFSHEELGDFIAGKTPEMAEYVKKRRLAFEFQQRLQFGDVSVGCPQPIEAVKQALVDGQLSGRPVSKGVVEGVVRVANNVTEAAALQPGEILIAPVTDVGWTPYFSLIAGLVTNVGSAVSHGAVIAREYGLPCIVNAQGATEIFKTGDKIRLDADTGVITKL